MKFIIKVNSKKEFNSVRKYYNNQLEDNYYEVYKENTSIAVDDREVLSYSPLEFYSERKVEFGPVLEFKDWGLMFNIELQPNKTITLTEDYQAVINYTTQTVEVGCQSVPFDKVNELYKLVNQK